MLSTTLNMQQSLKTLPAVALKPLPLGMGTIRKDNLLICVTTASDTHWCSLGLSHYFAFYLLMQVLRSAAPLNKGCAVTFSSHSQNLSGPPRHNIC